MSQIPKKPGSGIPSRVVSASATVTKQQPGENITHTQQRTRIAQVQSCCGGGGAGGSSTTVPQSSTTQSRLPPPPTCCTSESNRQPCSQKGNQTGLQQPRSLAQPGFGRSPQPGMSQLRPPAAQGVSQLRSPASSQGISQLRPPAPPTTPGVSQLRPPTTTLGVSQLRPPAATPGMSQLRPPSTTQGGSQLRPPTTTSGVSQLRPPAATPGMSQLRPPATTSGVSQLRPPAATPGMSQLRPPAATQSRNLKTPSPRSNFSTVQRQEAFDKSQQLNESQVPRKSTCRKAAAPGTMLPKPGLPVKMENTIKSGLMNKSLVQPHKKVSAKAKQVSEASPESIETPKGIEPVIQKAVFEKRIERDQRGEALVKNLRISNLNEQNKMDVVEMGIQQLDPKFATLGSREIVGVTSTISVSPSYTTVSKDYVRALTEEKEDDLGISHEEVAKLIEEEKEDVDNTLKIIPPELLLSPGKYEMKQRLQQLRLNSESVALLEQSIIQPEITPDEAQTEPSPEAMATVLHTVEIGITPDSTPDQVFNSLFREPPNENFLNLSSVTPGPLQDVVVPNDIPKEVHKESVTNDMALLTEKLNNIPPADIPYVDIFTRLMSEEQKTPEKGKNLPRTFEMIKDERSLWVNANLEHLVNVVGAEPADILDPFDLDELAKSQNLEAEMANGVEYFLEANPVQYMNRVQLRGTQMPTYFPGYMVAVTDFPDVIKLVKSPDEVFAVAWKSVQPKYFEEDSFASFM